MQQGFSMRSYMGLHMVEYNDLSVGMTLYISHDQQAAQAELDRWRAMPPEEAKAALMNRPGVDTGKKSAGQKRTGAAR